MSEIEKMYKNAGVKKINTHQSEIDNGDPRFTGISHSDSYIKYPPFTAAKQLAIVKQILFSTWWMNLKRLQFSEKFDEGLAQMINELWQDLTEEERKQIKEILE